MSIILVINKNVFNLLYLNHKVKLIILDITLRAEVKGHGLKLTIW